eukprot:CAMPEP_0185724266 /NCGR_PEP_ID=MMETSP1171-20130828/798_1 /TAXON_ID=374046 /ORGANISM="Helicotheca tamensis, Strain CCMP826" /LENGTH=219 /DNA_ID=CAMNT_0028392075 /DNA_START=12 /DNA_END=671 /DNA_ORIENTATION=-
MTNNDELPQPILNIEEIWTKIGADEENEEKKPLPILAIFGGVDLWHPDSESLCTSIGRELAKRLPSLTIVTGANAAVHDKIASAFYNDVMSLHNMTPRIYHLAPWGYHCSFKYGQQLCVGRDSAERRALLARCATVALSVEGGPGTADEMAKAVEANVPLIPLGRSGGASSGMFDAPSRHGSRPEFICQKDWDLCWDKFVSVDESAQAVSRIVLSIVGS